MVEIIIKKANKIFESDILYGGRKRIHTNGRIAVSNYLRYNLKMTLEKIGTAIDRDHCSVIYYVGMHDSLYKYNLEYRQKYNQLTETNKYLKSICNPCTFQFNKISA